MRVVMIYDLSDGYTYSCRNTHAIEYDSPEQALIDFEKACRYAKTTKHGGFKFAGEEFHCSDFMDGHDLTSPEFLTVDEWFTQESNDRVLRNP